ncbi:MAG: hypothetical protein ABI778_01575 [Ignavibacteriota bacterium]
MRHITYLVLTAVVLMPCVSLGQSVCELTEPDYTRVLWIGPTASINYNLYRTVPFAYPNFDPPVIVVQNGKGIAPTFGIVVERLLGYSNTSAIVFEAAYDSKSASFNSGSAKNVAIKSFPGPGSYDVATELSAELSYLRLNIGYKINFHEAPSPSGPAAQLSLYIGLPLTSKILESVTLTSTDDRSDYISTTRTEIPNVEIIRLGIDGRFIWDIPLSPNVAFSPFVGMDYAFTKVDQSDKSWRAFSPYAGVAAHFAITFSEDYVL